MQCYMVTFQIDDQKGGHVLHKTFYSDSPGDLCEQIVEFEEDLETDEEFVISKTISEVSCG